MKTTQINIILCVCTHYIKQDITTVKNGESQSSHEELWLPRSRKIDMHICVHRFLFPFSTGQRLGNRMRRVVDVQYPMYICTFSTDTSDFSLPLLTYTVVWEDQPVANRFNLALAANPAHDRTDKR